MNPYESELFDILNEALTHRYGGVQEHDIYPILFTRHSLLSYSNSHISLIPFLLSELNLSEKCTYKGIGIDDGFVLQHFVDNLKFRASLRFEDKELNSMKDSIDKSARFRAKKHKPLPEYNFFFSFYVIDEMKKYFGCKFMFPEFIDSIVYESDTLIFERTIEEKLEAYIHAVKLHSDHVAFVTEQKVEDYLVKNLGLIEDGMSFVSRQVIVPEGRVDILAKDRNGTFVIIEVKVEEDKDIIWQCMHYPKEISEMKNLGEVRMITFCPEYRKHIGRPLSRMKNVEMFEYKLISSIGEITEMKARRIQTRQESKVS